MEEQLLKPLDSAPQATIENNTLFREKLMKRFSAIDFVRVINPDTEDFTWQFMPQSKEVETFDNTSSTVPMKNTHREPPEVYKLAPGESAVIQGANAYVMIEALGKRLMAKKVISKTPEIAPGQARQLGFSDDLRQQEVIDMIYLGKNMPAFAPSKVEEHERPGPGRPKKTI
jgi:hypothetical protein